MNQRIAALDVLRGIALLLIFLVNIFVMALTTDQNLGLEGPLAAAGFVMLVGRGVALFSMLFGMGLILQMQRVGEGFPRIYRRRLISLAVIGLLHGVLLYVGDILFVYALWGWVLFRCRHWPARRLAKAAAILFLLGLGLAALDEGEAADPAWSAREQEAFADGPLGKTVRVNIEGYIGWLAISTLSSFNWRILAWFFVGAAWMRAGLLDPAHRRLHGRLLLFGLGLGYPIGYLALDFSPVLDDISATLVSFGYLGGILLFAHRDSPRLRWLAAAGRCALTIYIGQSVIGCLLFRWYGFDLYGRLTAPTLVGIAFGVFFFQTAVSVFWMRRFGMGPLEGVWRKITYRGAA